MLRFFSVLHSLGMTVDSSFRSIDFSVKLIRARLGQTKRVYVLHGQEHSIKRAIQGREMAIFRCLLRLENESKENLRGTIVGAVGMVGMPRDHLKKLFLKTDEHSLPSIYLEPGPTLGTSWMVPREEWNLAFPTIYPEKTYLSRPDWSRSTRPADGREVTLILRRRTTRIRRRAECLITHLKKKTVRERSFTTPNSISCVVSHCIDSLLPLYMFSSTLDGFSQVVT